MKRLQHTFVLGLLGGAMMTTIPSGCGSHLETAVAQGAANSGARLPEITVERLRRCVDEYSPEFAWYTHVHVRAKVDIKDDGRIKKVTTEDAPASSPDFGACTRQVLNDMSVPNSVLQLLLTMWEEKNSAGQTNATGNLVGHPMVLVVAGVTIVLSDVVVQIAGITVLFTVTMALDEVVDAARRRPRWENGCNEHRTACLMSDIADQPGGLFKHTLCHMCLEACMKAKGEWPSEIERFDGSKASCAYWRHVGN